MTLITTTLCGGMARADSPRKVPIDPARYTFEPVSGRFDNPVYMTAPNDDSERLFVVEQPGMIWQVRDGITAAQPFLDIRDRLPDEVFQGGYTERGLLGLSFSPDYRSDGLFYVFYTRADATQGAINVLARFRVSSADPDLAEVDSEQILFSFPHPNMNHNGGMLTFGTDGMLYLGLGDGGGEQGDSAGFGQSMTTIFGKILRLDVANWTITDAVTADDPRLTAMIWARGLRNPWRFSFDPANGDLYLADVGLGNYEEVNIVPRANQPQKPADVALNFGWNVYEGLHKRLIDQPDPVQMITPVVEYEHTNGQCAAVGGMVYRGAKLTLIQGAYFFADYCTGKIWALDRDPGAPNGWKQILFAEIGTPIASFGEDAEGELYIVNYKGMLAKLRYR